MTRAAGRGATLPASGAFLLAAGGLAFLVKAGFARAGVDDLQLVLAPTAGLLSALTGESFVFEPGFGWVCARLDYVLVTSCSGVNALVAMLLALAWTLRRRVRRPASVLAALAGCAAGAWSLTVLANAARLLLALRLHATGLELGPLDAGALHRLAGALVYLAALLLAVELASRLPECRRAPA